MTKSILVGLFASLSVAFGADSDIQKALDEALKVYPPGDYRNFVPQIPSQDAHFQIRILNKAERNTTLHETLAVHLGTLLQFDWKPTRLDQTLPERLTDNPFQRPRKLF
jgi:hypothetical protein